jgi:hypothetical protein
MVTTVTALSIIYEATALLTGTTTISNALRTLAENYHPVFTFAGILCGFLFMASLTGGHLPLFTWDSPGGSRRPGSPGATNAPASTVASSGSAVIAGCGATSCQPTHDVSNLG